MAGSSLVCAHPRHRPAGPSFHGGCHDDRTMKLESIDAYPPTDVSARIGLGLAESCHAMLEHGKELHVWESKAGQGLQAAHDEGLLHRDFKPANVLVTRIGTAKVTDFGLARLDDSFTTDRWNDENQETTQDGAADRSPAARLSELTQHGSVLGTPIFMAPEQHQGVALTAATDQYASCVSLWLALTGSPPFPADARHVRSYLARKLEGPPAWPSTERKVPKALSQAIRRGLSPDPSERWPSIASLFEALDYERPRKRRRRTLAGAGAICSLGALWGVDAYADARFVRGCEEQSARLDARWNAERSEVIERAFEATGLAYAPDTWSRVSNELDAYAASWRRARHDVCLTRRTESSAGLDYAARSVACLDDAAVTRSPSPS